MVVVQNTEITNLELIISSLDVIEVIIDYNDNQIGDDLKQNFEDSIGKFNQLYVTMS